MSGVLSAERLLSMPRVGTAVVGGGRIVVPVTTNDLDADRSTTRLWEVHTDGRPPRPLTGPGRSATKPALSPDGTRVAFLREFDGRPQVHVMGMDGGEPEAVTDLPLGALGVRVLPDSRRLLVVAEVYRERPSLDGTSEERDRLASRPDAPRVTEDVVHRFWDRWLTDGRVPHLFVVDGSAVRDLTPRSPRWMRWDGLDDPFDAIDVSPDGTRVAWCADRSDPPHASLHFALYLSDVATGAERCLTPDDDRHASRPRFSADGRRIVYGRTDDARLFGAPVRLSVHDLETGDRQGLLAGWDRSPAGWSLDGDDDIVFLAEDHARRPVWRLDAGGDLTELARDGTITGLSPLGDGTWVATRSSITRPPEVVRLSPTSGVTPLTRFTEPSMAGVALPAVSEQRVTAAGGDEVHLLVVTPAGLGDGPAPLIHVLHGCPHNVSRDEWHWRWNALALTGGRRRAALVNFHGSTSYGHDFTASIRGAWAERPADDVEAATDALIARGLADPGRIAVVGGSYGGYLTVWLAGRTDRYRCAVAHAPVTSLPGMYACDLPDIAADAHASSAWGDAAQVQRWSPTAHTATYRTPTLVLHGERDQRVPLAQGLELYGLLKAKGVDARLVCFPAEGHWILAPSSSLHWYGEVERWLVRYLHAPDEH
jgi:dipeptidyl aminopeptidase/acylaminoacyl peptidase